MNSVRAIVEHYQPEPGVRLAVRRWHALEPPLVRVVMLHGIISHGGWYDLSCDYLSRRGFDVHFLDRRGSGLNAQGRGDIDRWQTWVDDIVAYLEQLRGDVPLVLLGISWGGKIAPVVARSRPDLLAAMGLICPGIYARQQPGLGKRAGLRASRTLGVNERQVTIPLEDPALFTDSCRWQQYIRHDPLTLRQITMRFAREDLAMTLHARKSASWIYTPTLMMLSGRDRIVDNAKTVNYFRRIASRDKTLLDYPTAAHTFEFETEPEPILADLADWLRRYASRLS
jgi:alpha-beta hydrolase superfamily lysophospholipase